MVPPASKLADAPSEPTAERRARAQARIEARSEDQRRSFLRMVSHELRTPLNSILGFSELVLERTPELPEKRRRNVEGIGKNARHLMALIDDLLDVAGAGMVGDSDCAISGDVRPPDQLGRQEHPIRQEAVGMKVEYHGVSTSRSSGW